MHVSPAKHSSGKCDRKVWQTDRRRTKWSLYVAMLCRRHKNWVAFRTADDACVMRTVFLVVTQSCFAGDTCIPRNAATFFLMSKQNYWKCKYWIQGSLPVNLYLGIINILALYVLRSKFFINSLVSKSIHQKHKASKIGQAQIVEPLKRTRNWTLLKVV